MKKILKSFLIKSIIAIIALIYIWSERNTCLLFSQDISRYNSYCEMTTRTTRVNKQQSKTDFGFTADYTPDPFKLTNDADFNE